MTKLEDEYADPYCKLIRQKCRGDGCPIVENCPYETADNAINEITEVIRKYLTDELQG